MGIENWLCFGVDSCPSNEQDSPSYSSLCFNYCHFLILHSQLGCDLVLFGCVASLLMLQSWSFAYASSVSWIWRSLCLMFSVHLKFHRYRHLNSSNLQGSTQWWTLFLFYWVLFFLCVSLWRRWSCYGLGSECSCHEGLESEREVITFMTVSLPCWLKNESVE